MRGPDVQQSGMFSYVSAGWRVPAEHPIRRFRALVDTVMAQLDTTLAGRSAEGGRPSIPPVRLLCASLLQVSYDIRSKRLLMAGSLSSRWSQ